MGTVCPPVQNTGYCLSACENPWGTICPDVQIDGVLFVRMCKHNGVLFRRGTFCPAPDDHINLA